MIDTYMLSTYTEKEKKIRRVTGSKLMGMSI